MAGMSAGRAGAWMGGRWTAAASLRLALLLLAAEAPAGLSPPDFPVPKHADVWSVVVDETGRAALVKGHAGREALAWGSFTDSINQTGWAVLDIHTTEEADGQRQGYAAGFLEGALTSKRMLQHLSNMWTVDFHSHEVGSMPDAVRIFLAENIDWMWQQTILHELDPYWRTMASLLAQVRGLTDGYNHAAARSKGELRPLMLTEVFAMSLIDADMDDLVTAVALNGSFVNVHGGRHHGHRDHPDQEEENPDPMAELQEPERPNPMLAGLPLPARLSRLLELRPGRRGHCSALVQPAPGWTDLWVAHTTWDEYRAMLKIIKYLDMPIPAAVCRKMVFSSNPGALYSADDFYNTDTGLTVIETTITNYNATSWRKVAPQSVMTWGRAMVANRLATSGDEWTELFTRHNSGTCNNQWMVVDYKKFRPGHPPASGDGLLWISETMPGYSRRADMTDVLLSKGSWPSYNIPYFEDVRAVGGYFAMMKRHPAHVDDYSFTRDPRAQMFARAAKEGTINSLDSFVHFMRYTGDHDKLAKNDRCNAISSRCDLNPPRKGYDCFGAIDAKVSRWRPDVTKDLSFMGVLSPAHHGERSSAPPFAWSEQSGGVDGCRPHQHVGHPDVFNFSWYSFPGHWDRQRPGEAGVKRSRAHFWSFAEEAAGSDDQRWRAAGLVVAASLAATGLFGLRMRRRAAHEEEYVLLAA